MLSFPVVLTEPLKLPSYDETYTLMMFKNLEVIMVIPMGISEAV